MCAPVEGNQLLILSLQSVQEIFGGMINQDTYDI